MDAGIGEIVFFHLVKVDWLGTFFFLFLPSSTLIPLASLRVDSAPGWGSFGILRELV